MATTTTFTKTATDNPLRILSLLLCFALLAALAGCGTEKKEARIPLNAGSPEQFGMIRDDFGDYCPSKEGLFNNTRKEIVPWEFLIQYGKRITL